MKMRRTLIWALAVLLAGLLAACGGGSQRADDLPPPQQRVTIDPAVLVARHGESVTLRVDVANASDADLPSGYAFDLDEVVGKIDVTTAPCPADAGGSRACQDWTIAPRAGSAPGRYDIQVRTIGSRVRTSGGFFELTVVANPSPSFGAAVAVAALGNALVLNNEGRVFVLGSNGLAQSHVGYRRLPFPGIPLGDFVEPGTVSEVVEAPLPPGRWVGVGARGDSSYAVRDDGSVWAWGNNLDAAFGFGLIGDSAIETSPRQVPGLADVRAVSPGSPSFALLADGSLRMWGYDKLPPEQVCEEYAGNGECTRLFSGVRAMSTAEVRYPGHDRTYVLKSDGSVWRAGLSPLRIEGAPTSTVSIALDGADGLLMVGADGTVWHRRGDANPTQVAGVSDVVAVSARPSLPRDVFALRRDGTVLTWIPDAPAAVPQPVAGLANVVALGAHYAITGDCGPGGALWRIDRGGTAQAPIAVRVPGFGERAGCTPPPTVEVAIRVQGQGSIISAPAGIECGLGCFARFAQRGDLRLHPAPAAGWRFARWLEDGCDDSVAPAADLLCTAVFVEGGERRLSVRIEGDGRVTSSPAGIDCLDDCTQSYGLDTVVTLTATPARGHAFERFAGDDDCADGTLTIDAVRSCVAVFTPAAAPAAPSGFTASSASPSSVALRWDRGGTAVERYRLERADASGAFATIDDVIYGGLSTYLDATAQPNTTYMYRLTAINRRGESAAVTASSSTAAGFELTVGISGTGSGSVISEPGDIACGSECSETFAPGTTVLLFADGNFARWQGCDRTSGNRCSVVLDRARHVEAIFDSSSAPRWLLSVRNNGTSELVSAPPGIVCGPVALCIADFADGTVVTVTASSPLVGANGCDQLLQGQCTVTMDRSRFVVFGAVSPPPPPVRFTLTVIVDRDGGFVGTTDGEIGCGAPNSGQRRCSASYAAATNVGVYAAPLPGANVRLEAWQGDCAAFGAQEQITLTMNRDYTCRAVFAGT